MSKRLCEFCGDPFETDNPNKRFCCTRHQVYHYRGKPSPKDRICKGCGRSIYGTRYQNYCGLRECREKKAAEIRLERKKPTKTNVKPKLYTCQRCHEPTTNRINCPHCQHILSRVYAPGAEDVRVGWI